MILDNLQNIHKQIAGRAKLIAVTKGQPVEKILEAISAGQRDFGENYAQELVEHTGAVGTVLRDRLQIGGEHTGSPLQTHWHFIGHLQRNKVKQIIDKVSLIHSVDSFPLAQEIDKRAAAIGKVQPVLIEVNLAGESSKTGIAPEQLEPLVQQMRELSHIHLRGLMTMPPFFENPEQGRPYFQRLREIRDALNEKKVYKDHLSELSMGMTQDYEVALEEGATLVRVGTGVFGERKK